jgi:hypothetical protein
MAEEVVAVSKSKHGGKCQACQGWIGKGGFIAKVSREGSSTKDGNGPGIWVCEPCSANYEWTEDALPERHMTFRELHPDDIGPINLDDKVPAGFIKALRYSDYTRLAFRLGYEHGFRDGELGKEMNVHPTDR